MERGDLFERPPSRMVRRVDGVDPDREDLGFDAASPPRGQVALGVAGHPKVDAVDHHPLE